MPSKEFMRWFNSPNYARENLEMKREMGLRADGRCLHAERNYYGDECLRCGERIEAQPESLDPVAGE